MVDVDWTGGEVDLARYQAGAGERKLAFAVGVVSMLVFACLVPFAKVQLAAMPFFVFVYEAVLVSTDLLTIVLLVRQFGAIREPAVALLISGYVFTAILTTVHAMSYPGLFAPQGLVGGNAQTTAWIYMFWHSGFPIILIAYALTKGRPLRASNNVLWAAVAAVLVAVAAIVVLTTAGSSFLPNIMVGNNYSLIYKFVIGTTWFSSFVAFIVLWRYRSNSVLDTWLLVVMCAWIADIGLGAVFNQGRYDLGFYAGRVYGMMASSFILMVLFEPRGAYR